MVKGGREEEREGMVRRSEGSEKDMPGRRWCVEEGRRDGGKEGHCEKGGKGMKEEGENGSA